jgi:hypothetical protein
MMAELMVEPYAPSLIESMRSVGYSLETAVADLIDNSISAGSRTISIRYSPHDNPYVAILDDGVGMQPDELTRAMRHGSSNPWDERAANDLGRFGLGLKTASLSQCRKLTVISFKEGYLSARCWDLDLIAEREKWVLYVPEPEEIEELPHVDDLKRNGHGTIVLWQQLDRIVAGQANIRRALAEKMDLVREHLALVFHRYLAGEPGLSKIAILLNENPLSPFDPFLTWHTATIPIQEEPITVESNVVLIKPYILPHISKLSPDELRKAGGEEGLRRNQGFYIYRNRRLIIWGTWFRITRQEELSKLARVRVDIPNSLDHLWTLDIKKSAAHPPEEVKQNLRRIVDRIVGTSRRVYTYRGRKTTNDKLIHSWSRVEGREGISYVVNREHPVIEAFSDKLDGQGKRMLELLLDTIERTFPADALYADMASDRPRCCEDENIQENFRELALCLLNAADAIEGGKDRLLTSLVTLDPFCQYPEITESIIKELTGAN